MKNNYVNGRWGGDKAKFTEREQEESRSFRRKEEMRGNCALVWVRIYLKFFEF